MIAVVAIAAFGAFKLLNRPRPFNLQDMQIAKLTDSGKAAAVAISPDGRDIVYVLVDGEKQSLWVRNVVTKSDVQVLAPETVVFDSVNFSPDGNYIYFERGDSTSNYGDLYIMPVLGGAPRLLIRGVLRPISFSPDGKQFAFLGISPKADGVRLQIANADGSGVRLFDFRVTEPFHFGTSWSPDGKSVAVCSVKVAKEISWVISVVQVSDGSVKQLYTSPQEAGRPVWMPDGDSLVVSIGSSTEARHQLWNISYPGGEARRITNDLSDYSPYVDVTHDAKALATLELRKVSHIWIVPGGRSAEARQITFQETPDMGVAPAPGGTLLVRDGANVPFLMSVDGSRRTPLAPQANNVGAFMSCADKYVIFDSFQEKKVALWRVDADASNPTKLMDDAVFPDCSPDGKWVVYANALGTKFLRLPVEGGAPTEIVVSHPNGAPILKISPDGNWLAYLYQEAGAAAREQIAIIPASGGAPVHLFPLPEDTNTLRWSPDGKGVQFVITHNGAANIWEQPLTGGPRKQITTFPSGLIFDFAWSRDGKQLLLAKGETNSDVILISNFR